MLKILIHLILLAKKKRANKSILVFKIYYETAWIVKILFNTNEMFENTNVFAALAKKKG